MNYQNHYGGYFGYCLRRAIHISMLFIPIIYYWYSDSLANLLHLNKILLIILIIGAILFLEIFRLWNGILIVGQRNYEVKQISSATWGAISIGLVLFFAPKVGIQGAAIGSPLIWCLSIADPIIGEARERGLSRTWVIFFGALTIILIWGVSNFWLQGPWLLMPFIVPITVAAEWIKITWIDDNATMLLIPLIFILLFYSVFPGEVILQHNLFISVLL